MTLKKEFAVGRGGDRTILVSRNKQGEIHREDGPAIIDEKLDEYTWMNVFRNEIHLACLVFSKFSKNDKKIIPKTISTKYAWCLDGKSYSFPEWCRKLNKTDEEIVQLKMTY